MFYIRLSHYNNWAMAMDTLLNRAYWVVSLHNTPSARRILLSVDDWLAMRCLTSSSFSSGFLLMTLSNYSYGSDK